MQDTLSGLEDFARNYMDDILITSYTEKEHLDHIRQVFKRFRKFKMKLKLTKCEFGLKQDTIPRSHHQPRRYQNIT